MSLDVYLLGPASQEVCTCPNCGAEHKREMQEELFSANITHNLTKMAAEAGLYECLWRPDELGVKQAKELLRYLEVGIEILRANPSHFKQWEPKNLWGSYMGLLQFAEKYLEACKANPEALVKVSR